MRYENNYFAAFRTAVGLAKSLGHDMYIWMDKKIWNVSPVEPNFLPTDGFEIVSAV
jgi:hypothetical protein